MNGIIHLKSDTPVTFGDGLYKVKFRIIPSTQKEKLKINFENIPNYEKISSEFKGLDYDPEEDTTPFRRLNDLVTFMLGEDDTVVLAGDMAIQPVGEGGDAEGQQRQLVQIKGVEKNKNGDQCQTDHRQHIGHIPDAGAEIFQFLFHDFPFLPL